MDLRTAEMMEEGKEHDKEGKSYFVVCTDAQRAEMVVLKAYITEMMELKGTEHPDTLNSINVYAELCFLTRHFTEAEIFFRRAWHGRQRALTAYDMASDGSRRVFPVFDITIYNSQKRLADTLNALRRFTESEDMYVEALAGTEKHVGSKVHADLISIVEGLAHSLHEQKKYGEGEDAYRRLLAMYGAVHGEQDSRTLTVTSNFARLLRDRGNLPEAEQLCTTSLDNCTLVLGRDHPTTQAMVETMAFIKHAQGKSGEAEDMYRLALACNERVLGESHPTTIKTVAKIALLLRDQQFFEASEKMHRRALAACEVNYGPAHPLTLDEVHFIGVLTLQREEIPEAEEKLRRSLVGRQELYPDQAHPDTLATAHYLALLLQRQVLWRHDPRTNARLAECEFLFKLALDGRDVALGPDDKDSIETAACLAVFLFEEHRTLEAEKLWRRVVVSRRHTLGDKHKDTADAAYALGTILEARHKYFEASQMFHVSIEGYTELYARKGPRPEWLEEEEDHLHPVLQDAIDVYQNCLKMSVR